MNLKRLLRIDEASIMRPENVVMNGIINVT